MRIATWAFEWSLDKEHNLRNHLSCIDQAADAGADLIVFPEISLQGYQSVGVLREQPAILASAYGTAETVPNGPSVTTIIAKAKERHIHVVFGMTERLETPGPLYNTAVLVGPDGYIGRYRKVHVGPPERPLWVAGDDWPVFETGIGRIGLLICYDATFPEATRELTVRGADILVMPACWAMLAHEDTISESRNFERYHMYSRTRAVENTRWFVASNYVGQVGNRTCFGMSQVVSPEGDIAGRSTDELTQSMGLADIDVSTGITDAYANYTGAHVERDRRPETYRSLTTPRQ